MSLTHTQSAESENAEKKCWAPDEAVQSFHPNGGTLANLQSNIFQSCLWFSNFAGKRNDHSECLASPNTRQATPPSLPDAVTFQHLITAAANDENLVVPCQRIWVHHGLSRNEGLKPEKFHLMISYDIF